MKKFACLTLVMFVASAVLASEASVYDFNVRVTPSRTNRFTQAPVVIQRVEPIYTPDARAARVSGIVIVEARISETGTVDDVSVLKPLPFGLAEAAAEPVRQWKFRPATVDGKPVAVVFNLTVNFRLEKLE